MTRINCVPARELTDKHLVAEYRELPRLFNLIEAWELRGRPGPLPPEYLLGKGHVKFFYDKPGWLAERFSQLVDEMVARNFKPQYLTQWHRVKARGTPWSPTPEALAINRARIQDRLDGR